VGDESLIEEFPRASDKKTKRSYRILRDKDN
jgi:hypothetical protein